MTIGSCPSVIALIIGRILLHRCYAVLTSGLIYITFTIKNDFPVTGYQSEVVLIIFAGEIWNLGLVIGSSIYEITLLTAELRQSPDCTVFIDVLIA